MQVIVCCVYPNDSLPSADTRPEPQIDGCDLLAALLFDELGDPVEELLEETADALAREQLIESAAEAVETLGYIPGDHMDALREVGVDAAQLELELRDGMNLPT